MLFGFAVVFVMYENVVRQNRFVFFTKQTIKRSISALDDFIIISIIKTLLFSL